jgi:hypothetical protein
MQERRMPTWKVFALASLGTLAVAGCCNGSPAKPTNEQSRASSTAENALTKPRPHKNPPPARATKAPDLALPAVSAHPASVAAGSTTPTAEHPCGTTRVGDTELDLECFDESTSRVADAAQIVVPSATLNGGRAIALPSRVDHRLDGTEGPIRAQGSVPDCTGFSLTATIDNAVATSLGHPGDTSVLHLWSRYADTKMGDAVRHNKDHALAEESTWPYNVVQANAFLHASKCASGELKGAVCETAPDHAKQHEADEKPYVTLTGTTQVDSASAEALERKLAGGQDIWFCAKIGAHLGCGKKVCNLEKMDGSDDVYIRDFDARKDPGGHCMSLAGYQKTANGTYFLIHNSFGGAWGNHGYAFIHETTFLRNVEKGATFVVQAHAASSPTKGTPAEHLALAPCAAGQLRDSATGTCEAACPDGSARHDDVCGSSTSCPAGQINLTGACVPSAPSHSGTDAASGVQFTCAPGGCSYVLPKGKFGCEQDHCSLSCPAPRYHLAHGANGVVCTS